MHEAPRVIVSNTTPLIALAVATGSLDILQTLYDRVIVPYEVVTEILVGGSYAPGVAALMEATWLDVRPHPVRMPTYLANTLDPGEASVIHLALDENVAKVCIDEVAGRRIARLHGLTLTGSLGILVKAQRQGFPIDIATAIDRMRTHGIWLSETVVRWAISATNLPNDSN